MAGARCALRLKFSPVPASRQAPSPALRSRLEEPGEPGKCARRSPPVWRAFSCGKRLSLRWGRPLRVRAPSGPPGLACTASLPGSSAAPRPWSLLPSGTLCPGPTFKVCGPRQGRELSEHLGSHPCPGVPHIQRLGRPGAPGLGPACLCSRAPERTILPRITDTNRQADNRGGGGSPSQTQAQTQAPWGAGHGWGRGRAREGEAQGAGAAGALLPREGTDQGAFLGP